MTATPPGWYPDPADPSRERLWDGSGWLEKTRGADSTDYSDRSPDDPFVGHLRGPALPAPGGSGSSADPLVPPPPPGNSGPSEGWAAGGQRTGFGEAIGEGFRRYATFSGRSGRRAYWLFVLFTLLVGVVEGVVLGTAVSNLVFFLPGLAFAVRRLHDAGRSGWWVVVPLVNLVLLLSPGQREANRFGPIP